VTLAFFSTHPIGRSSPKIVSEAQRLAVSTSDTSKSASPLPLCSPIGGVAALAPGVLVDAPERQSVRIEVLMNPENEPQEVTGELEGRYSNYFKVGHNAFEFLLDFGQFYAESQRAQFHTRIITNPTYAKALLSLLRESIAQYEQTFGVIHGG
jgi:hypothetical protein